MLALQIEQVAKAFRVYFSAPPDVAEGEGISTVRPSSFADLISGLDYQVDHSIYFYLMDRRGQLLEYYGIFFVELLKCSIIPVALSGKALSAQEIAMKMHATLNEDWESAIA